MLPTLAILSLLCNMVAPYPTILMVSISNFGHLNPLIQLGNYLSQKEYKVILGTDILPHISSNVNFVTLGSTFQDSFYGKGGLSLYGVYQTTRQFIIPSALSFYLDVKSYTLKNKVDLIVCDAITIGCIVAANELNIPLVKNNPSPNNDPIGDPSWIPVPFFALPYPLGFLDWINNLSKKILYPFYCHIPVIIEFAQIRPFSTLFHFSDYFIADITLVNTFPEFDIPRKLASNIIFTGPLRLHKMEKEPCMSLVNNQPTILITMSSIASNSTFCDDFLQMMETVLKERFNVVALNCNGSKNQWATHSKWLSSAQVFHLMQGENTKLIVSHGGCNTIMESLSAGKPLLIMPQFGDQFDNGLTVERLNVGMAIHHNSSKEEITKAVLSLLSNSTYEKNAMLWKSVINSLGGVNKAAAYIELLVHNVKALEGDSVPTYQLYGIQATFIILLYIIWQTACKR